MRHVVLVGGSGLVGGYVARFLAEQENLALVALVRRKGAVLDKLPQVLRERVREVTCSFQDPALYNRIGGDIPCDLLFCAVGTTIKDAGSKAAFLAVDRDIPRALIARAQLLANRPVVGLVSSTGAAHPIGFYLSVKAEVERLLVASGLPHVIVRPSLLLGQRAKPRTGEALASRVLPPIFRVLRRLHLDHYAPVAASRPIAASDVAGALVQQVLTLAQSADRSAASVILEGDQLFRAVPTRKPAKA